MKPYRHERRFVDVLVYVVRCLTIVVILFTQVDIALTTVIVAINIERLPFFVFLFMVKTKRIILLSIVRNFCQKMFSLYICHFVITRNYRLLYSSSGICSSIFSTSSQDATSVQPYPFHLRNSCGKLKITTEGRKTYLPCTLQSCQIFQR